MLTRTRHAVLGVLVLMLVPALATTQVTPRITSPRQQFGHAIGDDYFLATYSQLERYWTQLDRESDRLSLVDIGRTAEGRTQWMAMVSAPENLRQLDRYRSIAQQLAHADGISDEQARALAAEGRAIVWIDGGLHADEVVGAQQLIETVYELASRTDAETMRMLRDVIVLAVPANPDGQELVGTWYMREPNPRRRSLANLPRLYQKYVGHDNNRDFFMATQPETINMNRVMYQEWFPQIVYDHHQTGPDGTVMFAPPFRDPLNYVFDPLIPAGIDSAAAAMHARFAAEGKAGVTMRTGSTYSTWWNGGLRTTAYFHNQIGLLTEIIGSPTPTRIPYVRERQQPSADLPQPIAPQLWHMRQSIDYSVTANRAVLDMASRDRERLLFNSYRMGKNSIERGSRDTWTPTPHHPNVAGDRALRDARAYILPADQPDFLTATKFVNALIRNGITVERATAALAVAGRQYPAGSFVVHTAQAFRPHILDMFEPQDHPDDIPSPGAAPVAPYDIAGWTLALQMGVSFDRILERLDGPFEKIAGVAAGPRGEVTGPAGVAGYLVSHRQNDAFVAVNRLLAAGAEVYWPRDRTSDGSGGTGSMFIAATPAVLPVLRQAAADLGLRFVGVPAAPAGDALKLRPVRIGLWDDTSGIEESGWIRWLLEQYEFPFVRVLPADVDAGGLSDRFDVIILPSASRAAGNVRRLRAFAEAGGTLMVIGQAAAHADDFGLSISNPVAGLPRERYYVPGSILRARVDNTLPLAYGIDRDVDMFFDDSPVFRLERAAAASGARRVAWFASPSPLRSGWAWGQGVLDGAAAVVEAPLGRGRVLLFGPEITFRAQPHGTFKFLFNGIYYAKATSLPRMSN